MPNIARLAGPSGVLLIRTFGAAAFVLAVLSFGFEADAADSLILEECRISAGPAFPSIKARCGVLDRPENPDDPESALIGIRVAVVPALNLQPQPDPVVPLAGGPGQGAVQFYSAYQYAFEPLRRDRDILLVDQRGTGESARMDCDVDDDIVDGEFSVEETLQFTKDCLDTLPHDPRYFTTSIAVKDLEAVRVALGYPALNLYGVSYGTRVAQHFARRYPDSTRTIVLDGVVPPQISLGPDIAVESQRAVDKIFARCELDEACSERFGDIAADFEELVAKLDDQAASVSIADPTTGRVSTVRFGRPEMAGAVRLLLYHPNTIAMLPLLVSEAVEGNYRPLAAQHLMTVRSMNDALAIGMHNAVMCTEDAPFYTPRQIDRSAIDASYMGALQIDAIVAMCSIWPTGPIDEDFKQPLSIAVPTLLLSGTADPITPPRYADLAARNLHRAWLLTADYQGHGQLSVGCMPRVIDKFVDQAELFNEDKACLRASFVMPFFLDFSGPRP